MVAGLNLHPLKKTKWKLKYHNTLIIRYLPPHKTSSRKLFGKEVNPKDCISVINMHIYDNKYKKKNDIS